MEETPFEAAGDPQPAGGARRPSPEGRSDRGAGAAIADAQPVPGEPAAHPDGAEGTESEHDDAATGETAAARSAANKKRRRGSRGGKGRKRPSGASAASDDGSTDDEAAEVDGEADGSSTGVEQVRPPVRVNGEQLPEMPERLGEGRATGEAAERALVRKPQIGDTRPAPPSPATPPPARGGGRQPARGGGQRGGKGPGRAAQPAPSTSADDLAGQDGDDARPAGKKRRRGGRSGGAVQSTVPRAGGTTVDPDVL
ncbi:MAG: hypothetical protein AB7U39_22875, partial [Ilumatobacteraceae bacterium]